MSYISNIETAKQLTSGYMKYQISLSNHPEDIAQAQRFRGKIFRNGQIDRDALDHLAIHGIVRNQYGHIVCVFRMLSVEGDGLDQCYSAQFYDLRKIKTKGIKSLELGRFCVHPDYNDPNILRLAWAELTKFVLNQKIDLLFGCSSFRGADTLNHLDALNLLKEKHLAPRNWMPLVKSPDVFRFANFLKSTPLNLEAAQKSMPPLLRAYLSMGGWVSDHAVIDSDLDTVHVFTGIEVQNIPIKKRMMFIGLLSRG